MKKSVLGILFSGAMLAGSANAANITVYFSPSCPHCHHAYEFISNNLIYEYPNITVTMVSVMEQSNRQDFANALNKCKYQSGGVPVIVVGEKCFQGYADFMQDQLREAVAVDLDANAVAVAAENKKAMETDADAFRKSHANNKGVITEKKNNQ